jgi:hypothetical protein
LAFAISIALNEIAIGLLHRTPPAVETRVEPTIVTIAHRTPPTPPPTPVPKPTPTPTPPPVLHVIPHATLAPHPQIAAARTRAPKEKTHGGSVARHADPALDVYAELSHTGLGHGQGITGSGTGTGVGAGNGGGDAGNAEGNGSGGNGTGDVNANTPCGYVDFLPPKIGEIHGTTYYETVDAIVHFPDGHTETARFPYKWTYADGERTDPWSATNMRAHPTMKTPVQTPPPSVDPNSLSPVIQYILQHTNDQGKTSLQPCPTPT